MVSGGVAGLRAAAAAIAVLAVLVVSSQGHPREKPLCSDCQSLCDANCTAVVDAACRGTCNPPVDQYCQTCKSGVLQGCCPDFCSTSNDTSTVSSCCPSDCVSGHCATCSCDYCNAAVQNSCSFPCSGMRESYVTRCQDCKSEAGKQCMDPCISDCQDHCVKKDCLNKP